MGGWHPSWIWRKFGSGHPPLSACHWLYTSALNLMQILFCQSFFQICHYILLEILKENQSLPVIWNAAVSALTELCMSLHDFDFGDHIGQGIVDSMYHRYIIDTYNCIVSYSSMVSLFHCLCRSFYSFVFASLSLTLTPTHSFAVFSPLANYFALLLRAIF